MEGNRWRSKPWIGRADAGVLNWLRLPRRIAVIGSAPPGERADSTMGVAPPAIGVLPSSPVPEKNLALACELSNDVMSFSAEFFAMLRCGPWFTTGGDSGGLASSGTVCAMFGKLSCCADGDDQGSVDSRPVQAKLRRVSSSPHRVPDSSSPQRNEPTLTIG